MGAHMNQKLLNSTKFFEISKKLCCLIVANRSCKITPDSKNLQESKRLLINAKVNYQFKGHCKIDLVLLNLLYTLPKTRVEAFHDPCSADFWAIRWSRKHKHRQKLLKKVKHIMPS